MFALPADQNRTQYPYPRQLKTGGTYPAKRLSFFYPASSGFSKTDVASGLEKPLLAGYPSSLLFCKKKRKRLIAGYEARNETYQKTISTESHSEQDRKRSEKNLSGNSFVWEFIAKTTSPICG